jgi:hypothetical protein
MSLTPQIVTPTIFDLEARFDNQRVILRLRIHNIQLGDSTFRDDGAKGFEGCLETSGLTGCEMGLGADPVNWDASRTPGFTSI